MLLLAVCFPISAMSQTAAMSPGDDGAIQKITQS